MSAIWASNLLHKKISINSFIEIVMMNRVRKKRLEYLIIGRKIKNDADIVKLLSWNTASQFGNADAYANDDDDENLPRISNDGHLSLSLNSQHLEMTSGQRRY